MDCSLLYVPQFFLIFFFFFFLLLIYFLSNFLLLLLGFIVVVFLFFLSKIFSFLTGLSSLVGPLGFWHLALSVGVCSLECNNSNNNNVLVSSVYIRLLGGSHNSFEIEQHSEKTNLGLRFIHVCLHFRLRFWQRGGKF